MAPPETLPLLLQRERERKINSKLEREKQREFAWIFFCDSSIISSPQKRPLWHLSFLAPTVLCVLESRSFSDSSSCLMSIHSSSHYFSRIFFCFSDTSRSCSPAKPTRHHGHLFHRPADLQPQARKLNKFRNLCGNCFFYFFPKHLISISRKKISMATEGYR